MDRLLAYLKNTADRVEDRLNKILPRSEQRPETLHDAMRYSVLGGGKRLRPAMTIAAFEAVDGPGERSPAALDAGCAIELLHCYSLVHDDLPSMDNDTLRRNRLTTHKAFGEATAILVGDALQTFAFEVMAGAWPQKAGPMVIELARASGSVGMAGGQMLDLENEGAEQDLDVVEMIDRWKTGALIVCCCRVGGIVGGAGPEGLAALTEYGEALGVLYQVTDDLLDLTATAGQIGKTPGKDKKAGKLTYPAAIGVEKARQLAVDKIQGAKAAINRLGKGAVMLRLLADFVFEQVKDSGKIA